MYEDTLVSLVIRVESETLRKVLAVRSLFPDETWDKTINDIFDTAVGRYCQIFEDRLKEDE